MTTGSSASTREREDVVGGIGAVGNGRWMSPYALYALDWCKWPVSNGGYGRVAMCSYAEDSHNYVSSPLHTFLVVARYVRDDPRQSYGVGFAYKIKFDEVHI